MHIMLQLLLRLICSRYPWRVMQLSRRWLASLQVSYLSSSATNLNAVRARTLQSLFARSVWRVIPELDTFTSASGGLSSMRLRILLWLVAGTYKKTRISVYGSILLTCIEDYQRTKLWSDSVLSGLTYWNWRNQQSSGQCMLNFRSHFTSIKLSWSGLGVRS